MPLKKVKILVNHSMQSARARPHWIVSRLEMAAGGKPGGEKGWYKRYLLGLKHSSHTPPPDSGLKIPHTCHLCG
jgi:hypothetical protein